jgi:hypothetical protein
MNLPQFSKDGIRFGDFFRPALANLAQSEAQGVKLGRNGLQVGQLCIGVALAGDKLAPHLRGSQATIQPGSTEGGIGLDVICDEVANVVEQMWRMELDGFASAAGGGVLAGDASTPFVQGFAEGIATPAEEELGLSLSQVERSNGIGHVASACWAPWEGVGSTTNQGNSFGSQIHGNISW